MSIYIDIFLCFLLFCSVLYLPKICEVVHRGIFVTSHRLYGCH